MEFALRKASSNDANTRNIMSLKAVIFTLFISSISFNSLASIIFDFTITEELDSSSFFKQNSTVGDMFSIGFVDDSNFETGISSADIESVSINTAFLGSFSLTPPFFSISASSLAEIFSFTNLGGNSWRLDLLIGTVGQDNAVIFVPMGDFNGALQLGQPVDGNGSTNLSLENADRGFQFMQFSNAQTLSATVQEVSTPTLFSLFILGCLVIGITRKRKS